MEITFPAIEEYYALRPHTTTVVSSEESVFRSYPIQSLLLNLNEEQIEQVRKVKHSYLLMLMVIANIRKEKGDLHPSSVGRLNDLA